MLLGTPVIAPRRYIALSKLPVNNLAPVRKRFPTEADWKLKTEEGRARFTISRLMVLRKERISSRVEEGMEVQRGCVASTIESHSLRASVEEEERRWLKKILIAVFSAEVGSSGIRRTRRPEEH